MNVPALSSGPEVLTPGRESAVRHHTARLTAVQAVLWVANSTYMTAGPIAMYALTRSAVMSGLLIAVRFCAWAVSARVTGLVMDRVGRRPGLMFGYVALALASLSDGASISLHLPWMLVFSGILFGAGDGAASLGRAAVADMYAPADRARAVGRMVTAGTLGSVGGPLLINYFEGLGGGGKDGELVFLPWLFLSVMSAGSFLLMTTLKPDPRELAWHLATDLAHGRRRLRQLLALAPLRATIATGAVGWLVMVALMTSVPLAMRSAGVDMLPMALVMSLHFGAMFAFSAAWGRAATRLGFRSVLALACLLMAGGAGLTGWVGSVPVAGTGLFLVGLGWSGTYVGATAAVTEFTRVGERAGTLGFSDLVGAGAAASGALLGGVLFERAGSFGDGLGIGIAILPVLVMLLLTPARSWAQAVSAADEGPSLTA